MTDDHPHADPLVAEAEQRRQILRELSEICMDIARALRRDVIARAEPDAESGIQAPPAPGGADRPGLDPAEAFSRISRAIRLTIMLEDRLADRLRRLVAGAPERREKARQAEEDRREAAAHQAEAETRGRRDTRRQTIHDLVREVIDREAETIDEHFDLEDALAERLSLDPAYDDLQAQATETLVRRLCDDLQLTPDWSRWTGEAWKPDPQLPRPHACDFNRPSRKPLFKPDGEPLESRESSEE